MRTSFAIAYFSLLMLIFLGLGLLMADEVYVVNGYTYHQRVFGFTLEIPADWQVFDEGAISPNGEYQILVGPNLPDDVSLYISFLPVNGLSLIEFCNENCMELGEACEPMIKASSVGNLKCMLATFRVNPDPTLEFPNLSIFYGRIGDHFMQASVFSFDRKSYDTALGVLDSIKADDKLREVSFLSVKNFNQYGRSIGYRDQSALYLINGDPSLMTETENADGSENLILDDFAYPARFPAGEQQDSNGYRIQFYDRERYHIDNRGKKVDVYVPDMGIKARNITLNVDMRFEGGHPMKGNGIIFRGDENGFYLFDVSPDGFFALYQFSGGFQTIVEKTFSDRILPYDSNRIGIEAIDNQIALYINGEMIKKVEVKDDSSSGFAGFYVCAGSWVSFDDYRVEIDK